mgnify:CR=1 FL=1
MTVKNVDKLLKKISVIESNVPNVHARTAIAVGLAPVKAQAILLVPNNSGELRQSITQAIDSFSGGVRGTLYTNKAYASYVEFGTGPKGAENHKGTSPLVSPTYTMQPWYIHESQIDSSLAEQYHWPFFDTPNGRFYECTGQPAQPFMYPALKNTEKIATKKIRDYLSKKIREDVGK